MPEYWGSSVTLTYDPEVDKWTGVVLEDLSEFSGTLFSVLNELDEYMSRTHGN